MQKLKHHYATEKGWVNDPNGLVYYKGYYHVFYQHDPFYETPWDDDKKPTPKHWGHARTKDFLTWEELPVAISPDRDYDVDGCWSGTAIVKDGILYLAYASISEKRESQTVSIAYSTDGVSFTKYENNPVIRSYPADGSKDFRDPSLCEIDGVFYCVMASGNGTKARLLLYKSDDLFDWQYLGIIYEKDFEGDYVDGDRIARALYECPSVMTSGDKLLMTASVGRIKEDGSWVHDFLATFGTFKNGRFTAEYANDLIKGPDQYAGQVFKDHKGRCILISWIPGWRYAGYVEGKDVGCMSMPYEIKLEGGRITAYPVEEVRHLLKDTDEMLVRTENGFTVERSGRPSLVYEGKIDKLELIRDGYVMEIFINGGEEVYTVLL